MMEEEGEKQEEEEEHEDEDEDENEKYERWIMAKRKIMIVIMKLRK